MRKELIWHTIGNSEDFTLEEARSRADAIKAQVGKWKEEGCIGPVPIAKPTKALTLGALFDDYCTFHVAKAKNPLKALEDAKWFFDAYLSTLRGRELSSITTLWPLARNHFGHAATENSGARADERAESRST